MSGRMLAIIALLIFFNLPGLSGQPFVCEAGKYLTVSQGGFSKMYEVDIDPVTGNASFLPLSAPNVGVSLNAIGYRSTDNYIYGLDINTFNLVQVDATGNGTVLGSISGLPNQYGYYGAACTPDGKFLVLIGLDFSSEVLVFVNLDDLTVPAKVINLVNSQPFVSTDIAFNPLDGLLYGFDANANRMYSIDPETGVVDQTKYPTTNLCDAMGAVFFDSFGNFYGYGNNLGSNSATTLFRANVEDGIIEKIASGPTASGKDACSCPYTVELRKEVFPRQAFPCTIVDYVFTIANITDNIQVDLQLLDHFPVGLTYHSGPGNTFGGEIVSTEGDDFFQLINMNVPPGIHEITVRAYVEEGVEGVLSNQAMLIGLPAFLGGDKLSDDPSTVLNPDSTRFEVFPLAIDLQYDTIVLCQESELTLEATTFDAEYLWQDGYTEATYLVNAPGNYAVTVSTDCDVAIDNVVVLEQEFVLIESIPENIALGDSVILQPIIIGNAGYNVVWEDPLGNSLSCLNCETPIATPYDPVIYSFEVFPLGSDCTLEGSIRVTVDKDRGLYVPNVFSPNNDGLNDTWDVFGGQPFRVLDLSIYSRWGEKVYAYSGDQYDRMYKMWDGRLRGRAMQAGVFVWRGTFEFLDGFQVEMSGDLTLMR